MSLDCQIDNWLAAGEKLADGIDAIRGMLYGLALDARQAVIAQKAIDEAVDARRENANTNRNDDRQSLRIYTAV
jgi:hypothetical protein